MSEAAPGEAAPGEAAPVSPEVVLGGRWLGRAPFDPRPPPAPAQHTRSCPRHPTLRPRLLETLGILCCFLECLLEVEYIKMFPSAALFRSQRYVLYTVNSTPHQKYVVLEAN